MPFESMDLFHSFGIFRCLLSTHWRIQEFSLGAKSPPLLSPPYAPFFTRPCPPQSPLPHPTLPFLHSPLPSPRTPSFPIPSLSLLPLPFPQLPFLPLKRGSGGITPGEIFEMLHARRCILAHFGGGTEHRIVLILWPKFLLERWKAAYFSGHTNM